MALVDHYRRVDQACTNLAERSSGGNQGSPEDARDGLLGVMALLGEVSPFERFQETQRGAGPTASHDGLDPGVSDAAQVTGREYGARVTAAWSAYKGSLADRVGQPNVSDAQAWERFRADETSLLVDDGFKLVASVEIVRSVKKPSVCVRFLESQDFVTPGEGISLAVERIRTYVTLQTLVGVGVLAVIKRLRAIAKLQMVLEIDAQASTLGFQNDLTTLSGLLSDVSAMTFNEIENASIS